MDERSFQANEVSNDVLIRIYEQLGDLRSDAASARAATESTAARLDAISIKMDDMNKDIQTLAKQEAKNAVKWGMLTFAATTLLVTGMNYAIGKETPQLVALAPTAKEIQQNGLWEDNEKDYPIR